jgi:hypothetical protein
MARLTRAERQAIALESAAKPETHAATGVSCDICCVLCYLTHLAVQRLDGLWWLCCAKLKELRLSEEKGAHEKFEYDPSTQADGNVAGIGAFVSGAEARHAQELRAIHSLITARFAVARHKPKPPE